MELRHLRYFLALADERHFGRAASKLHIVQSALSRQIITLERELGVDLFDRANGVALTPAGEAFYEDARASVERAEKAARKAQATARGELGSLDIGFISPAMWSVLPSVLREHRGRFPELRFHLREIGSTEQVQRLREGSLDVGFVRAPRGDNVLQFEPIWRESIVVGLPDNHRLATDEEIDLGELRDEAFIALPRQDGPPALHDLYASLCLSYGFSPRLLEEGNSPAALSMVSMGLGVTLVPESAQDASFQGIVFRPLVRPTPEIDLMMAYRRTDRSAALRTFLETVRRVVPSVRAHGRAVVSDHALSG